MEPLGLGPTHGPDPACPEAWFESRDKWYAIGVFPLRLSHRLALELGVGNAPIMGELYEELLGGLAAGFDPRHKLLVWRKQPPLFNRHGWLTVQVEVHPDRETAESRRREMLAGWDPQIFSDAPALGARELRRILMHARRAARGS